MGIFDKRVAFKPFEYPEILVFKDAIRHSYWLHSEWNFTSDVHDFHALEEKEKNIIKNAMLAISQIEVSVKKFWSDLGDRFPKSEFDQVGITFGESEIRHSDAYSHLLEILGMNDDFEELLKNPQILGRVNYLTKYIKNSKDQDNNKFAFTLTLFSIFVENVSLFSQFLIIKSFNKYKNILKDIDNVVQATQLEESLHAKFGAMLVGLIKEEHPEWFDEQFYKDLEVACQKSFEAEKNIIDWIFEKGDLDFISKEIVIEFVKDRFNQSLIIIDAKPIFEVNENLVNKVRWFEEEIKSDVNVDFFHKKSTNYTKKIQAITEDSLF